MFKPLKRRIGSLTYSAAGQPSTLQLPRNYNYRKLLCRLSGSVVVSGGSGAGAVHTYAAYRAISKIEIVANGRDTIISIPAEKLHMLNRYDYGCAATFTNPSNDAAATYSFDAFFIVPFALQRAIRPIDTLFPSAGLSTFDLKVTWGAGADMFTGAVDFTSATIQTTTQLDVTSFEEIGAVPKGVGVAKLFEIDQTITAASSNLQIKLPTGNTYRGIMLHTKNDEVPVDTIIDGVSIESGTEVYQKFDSYEELLEYNKLQYAMESKPVGYVNLDFMDSDGFLTEILDARSLSELTLRLNVALPSGTTRKVQVYPQELIIPKA